MEIPGPITAGGEASKPLLERILNRVFRCSHRQQGRPMTLRGETFAVCLDCGQRVAYDLRAFRPGKPAPQEKVEPEMVSDEPGDIPGAALVAPAAVLKDSKNIPEAVPVAASAVVLKDSKKIPEAAPVAASVVVPKDSKNIPEAVPVAAPVVVPKDSKNTPEAVPVAAPVVRNDTKIHFSLPIPGWFGRWSREGLWLGLLAAGLGGGIYYSEKERNAEVPRFASYVRRPLPRPEGRSAEAAKTPATNPIVVEAPKTADAKVAAPVNASESNPAPPVTTAKSDVPAVNSSTTPTAASTVAETPRSTAAKPTAPVNPVASNPAAPVTTAKSDVPAVASSTPPAALWTVPEMAKSTATKPTAPVNPAASNPALSVTTAKSDVPAVTATTTPAALWTIPETAKPTATKPAAPVNQVASNQPRPPAPPKSDAPRVNPRVARGATAETRKPGRTKPSAEEARAPRQMPRLEGEGPFVLAAREQAAALEMSQHKGSLGKMIHSGILFTVSRGTPIRILEKKKSVVRIVITEGDLAGQEGWVPSSRVSW